jgi:hypothetical protein
VPRIGCCRSDWRPDGALAAKAIAVDAMERETRRQERVLMTERINTTPSYRMEASI